MKIISVPKIETVQKPKNVESRKESQEVKPKASSESRAREATIQENRKAARSSKIDISV